jgi:hypothetical protein
MEGVAAASALNPPPPSSGLANPHCRPRAARTKPYPCPQPNHDGAIATNIRLQQVSRSYARLLPTTPTQPPTPNAIHPPVMSDHRSANRPTKANETGERGPSHHRLQCGGNRRLSPPLQATQPAALSLAQACTNCCSMIRGTRLLQRMGAASRMARHTQQMQTHGARVMALILPVGSANSTASSSG